MEISKKAKLVHRQMLARRELSQQIPAPREKARMQKPQDRGKFLVQILGGARGMVMDEIDTCINRALSLAIPSFGNKFCLRMRSRLIKALENRFTSN